MAKSERSAEYTSNIRDLLRFLTREGESGYAFVTALHEGIIPAVNRELTDLARQRGKTIELLWYEDPKDLDISFAEQLRQAAAEADAVIVTDLDRPMRERPNFVDELNFSREAINSLQKPVLFWLTPENLALVGNRAADLFSQRRMMTVQFENAPEINAPAPELERRFNEEYRSKEDYETLRTRVNLLKKQLGESLEAGMPRHTIAADIALPLAKTYSGLDLHEEALGLLEQFEDVWDESNARQLYERSGILTDGKRQNEAIACLEKARELLEKGSDLELLADVEVRLGDVFEEVGQLNTALRHYEQNLVFREKVLEAKRNEETEKEELSIAYYLLGSTFESLGKLENALVFFEKGIKVSKELCVENSHSEKLKTNIAILYNRLGGIYASQGRLEIAFVLSEKALQIEEELLSQNQHSEKLKNNLSTSYDRLGNLFRRQGKLEKALPYYEKSMKIGEDLCIENPLSENLKRSLAHYCNHLGILYQSQGKLKMSLVFFEKHLKIVEELCDANPLSEQLKRSLGISYSTVSYSNNSLGNMRKAIYYSLREINTFWNLCQYVRWQRHSFLFINSIASFIMAIIPPPISTILVRANTRMLLLFSQIRYRFEKPTPPPTF